MLEKKILLKKVDFFIIFVHMKVQDFRNILFSVYRDANLWSKAGVEDPCFGPNVKFFVSASYM